jgi:hypothetical protein
MKKYVFLILKKCIKRQKNNFCDASNPDNFTKNYSFLSNNESNFNTIMSGGVNEIDKIDEQINDNYEIEINKEKINEEEMNKQNEELCLKIGAKDLEKIKIEYLNFFIISYNDINNQNKTLFKDNNIFILLKKYKFFNDYILKKFNNIKELKELIKLKELIELKDSLIKKIEKN